MKIREVREYDDYRAIAEIYKTAWQFAYSGIVPQKYLDSLSADRWLPLFDERSIDSFVLIENGEYIGTSAVCASRDEALAGWGELVSIYLLPEHFGCGGALPLLNHTVNSLLEKGFKVVYLEVLEENRRARRFYEKHGFMQFGQTASTDVGGKPLGTIRYKKHFE